MDEIEIDRAALIQTFLAEAEETLVQMEQLLVRLEAHPDDGELLHGVFRAAHTLKGGASLVNFDAVRELAHDVEDLLDRVRARSIPATPSLITLLLRSVDVLRAAVSQASAGSPPPATLGTLREALARAAAGDGVQAPEAPDGTSRNAGAAQTLRVEVCKLNRMLDLSGEIAIARGRLTDLLEKGRGVSTEEILAVHRESDRLYLDLQELIMQARMVPLGPVFHQHARTVRDAAAASGKQARLVVEGEGVEVDTAIVEHIRDPLLHMVRNAIDHGIETPEARRQAGKDPVGRLTLRAARDGGSIVIQVVDDGAGLPRRRIAQRAEQLGLVADAAAVTDDEAARLVFEPGLSTSDTVTEISGRGVGMDVVRRNVEALRGSVSVETGDGRGTSFTLRLPLSLAIIQGFRVGIGGESYVLPLDAVVECVELPPDARRDRESGVLELRGAPLPYLRLRRQFGVPGEPPPREHVVVVRHGDATAGVAVDELLGESQTVVKPLGRMFGAVPGVSGSSIMGDGRVALVLEVSGLLREALKRAAAE